MKKTRKKRAIPELVRDASEDEIVRWATKYDAFDRVEAGISQLAVDHSDLDELLEASLFQNNTAQLNMRIPPALKAVLAKLAKERTTDATTLGRVWLAERIRTELKQKTIPSDSEGSSDNAEVAK